MMAVDTAFGVRKQTDARVQVGCGAEDDERENARTNPGSAVELDERTQASSNDERENARTNPRSAANERGIR
jgi:hypothetical protein